MQTDGIHSQAGAWEREKSKMNNRHVVVQDGKKTVGVVHMKEDKYYFALKATASGETVFLTSFRKTSDSDLKRLKKKVEQKKAILIFGSF
jgi:hypothetical protein